MSLVRDLILSVIKDLNKVAVFGVGMIGAEGPAVLDSGTNKTVFRGTIRFGGDLVGRTNEIVAKILKGEIVKSNIRSLGYCDAH